MGGWEVLASVKGEGTGFLASGDDMQGANELEKRRASKRKGCWRIGLAVGSWCWVSVQPNIGHGKWAAHGWN